MWRFLTMLANKERGLSGQETAIVLTIFVVIVSVWAFAMLSTGIAATQPGQGGDASLSPPIRLKGSVLANADESKVTHVMFTVESVAGGEPIELTEPDDRDDDGLAEANSDNMVIISYRDPNQRLSNLVWTVTYVGKNDGDLLLEAGELAQIDVDMSALTPTLGANTTFTLEIKLPQGDVLILERTTPPALNTVMDLH